MKDKPQALAHVDWLIFVGACVFSAGLWVLIGWILHMVLT